MLCHFKITICLPKDSAFELIRKKLKAIIISERFFVILKKMKIKIYKEIQFLFSNNMINKNKTKKQEFIHVNIFCQRIILLKIKRLKKCLISVEMFLSFCHLGHTFKNVSGVGGNYWRIERKFCERRSCIENRNF